MEAPPKEQCSHTAVHHYKKGANLAPILFRPYPSLSARVLSTAFTWVERLRAGRPPAPLGYREVGRQMMTILGSWTLYGLKRYFSSVLLCVGLTLASAQFPVFGQTAEPATSA